MFEIVYIDVKSTGYNLIKDPILSIGFLWQDSREFKAITNNFGMRDEKSAKYHIIDCDNEEQMLKQFASLFKNDKPYFVTYNGFRFSLKKLELKMRKYGLEDLFDFEEDCMISDLRQNIIGLNSFKFKSTKLNYWANKLGIPIKMKPENAFIKTYNEKQYIEHCEYLKADLNTIKELFWKLKMGSHDMLNVILKR